MLIILILTNLGVILGAYGVYKYGALQEYLQKYEQQNKEFATEIEVLSQEADSMKTDVDQMTKSVDGLKRDTFALNDTLSQYNEIKNKLAELCADNGDMKNVSDMLDSLNNGYAAMCKLMIDNKKAALLASFYHVASRDDDNGTFYHNEYNTVQYSTVQYSTI